MEKENKIKMVRRFGGNLNAMGDECKDDKEIVMLVVKQNPYMLRFASDKLKNDKEVVMAAVKNYGLAIQFASLEQRSSKVVAIVAIKQHIGSYYYCCECVQRDPDVIALADKKIKRMGGSGVDGYICDELIELKKRYGVSLLVDALEMEAAEKEVDDLYGNLIKDKMNFINKKNRL